MPLPPLLWSIPPIAITWSDFFLKGTTLCLRLKKPSELMMGSVVRGRDARNCIISGVIVETSSKIVGYFGAQVLQRPNDISAFHAGVSQSVQR